MSQYPIGDIEPQYIEFFLNCSAAVVELELLEISHPAFTGGNYGSGTIYKIVKNASDGVVYSGDAYLYYPFVLSKGSRSQDLDYSLDISFGDLGEITTTEIKNIIGSVAYSQMPISVSYMIFRSDDLTAPIFGPIDLKAKNFNWNGDGFTLECRSRISNKNKTGTYYDLMSYPSLKTFL